MFPRLLRVSVVCMLLVGAFGTAVAGEVSPYNRTEIKIASAYDEESIVVKVARKFKEILERRTEGAVKVSVLPGGSVGTRRRSTRRSCRRRSRWPRRMP